VLGAQVVPPWLDRSPQPRQSAAEFPRVCIGESLVCAASRTPVCAQCRLRLFQADVERPPEPSGTATAPCRQVACSSIRATKESQSFYIYASGFADSTSMRRSAAWSDPGCRFTLEPLTDRLWQRWLAGLTKMTAKLQASADDNCATQPRECCRLQPICVVPTESARRSVASGRKYRFTTVPGIKNSADAKAGACSQRQEGV
jgi:hypothetical protein